MALALQLSTIDEELRRTISKICTIKPRKSQYDDDPAPVVCYTVNKSKDMVYIPLGIWSRLGLDLEDLPDSYPKRKLRNKKPLYTLETDPKGYRDQDVVFEEALERLESDRVVFLALPCGFGKTTLGNYAACHTKLPTAVLCHVDKVNDQWVDEFETFSNAKVQRVKGKAPIDPKADVYVIGIQKAATLAREDLQHIGLVILDEAHIATVTAFSKALLRFQPKYVIGLSATPERADGLQKLLTMYFGPSKSFVHRQEVKDFTVYKVQTPFKPEIKYTMVNGRMVPNWTHIINSIEYNEERHDLIVSLVRKHPERKILILSGRQEQARSVYKKLVAIFGEEEVRLLIGPKKGKGANPRITVAGAKKMGTGFDDPELNMLIIASDCKNVKQWEGRIRAVGNIIYDLVDYYKTFENHWEIRYAWYIVKGAVVIVIDLRGEDSKNTRNGIPSKRLLGSKR